MDRRAERHAPPEPADARCWQCGAPGRPDCAYSLRLVAPSGRTLDPCGFPVRRGAWRDSVQVPVPRCTACRDRSRSTIVTVFGSAGMGAVLGTLLQPLMWPDMTQQTGRFAGGIGNLATGIGLVVGFAVAAFGVFLERRRDATRSVLTYPPVVRLRRIGWQLPTD